MVPLKERSKIVQAVDSVEDKYGSLTKAPDSAIKELHAYIHCHYHIKYCPTHRHRYPRRHKKVADSVWRVHGVCYSDSPRVCHAIWLLRNTGLREKQVGRKLHFSMGFTSYYHLYHHYVSYSDLGMTIYAKNEQILLDRIKKYNFPNPPINFVQISKHQYAGKLINRTYYQNVHYVRKR